MAAACGDEGGTPDGGACDPGLPQVPSASAAEVQGSIRVQDRAVMQQQDGASTEQLQTLVSGGFQRMVTTSTAAQFVALGTQCVGLVSAPISGDFDRLDGGAVVIEAALGTERIEPDDGLVYRSIVGGERRLSGLSELTVSGGGADTDFPGFSIGVPAPSVMRLEAPATDGSARLPTSELAFRWPAGNGELVLVDISPQPPLASGGKVQCFFEDDGCGVVPASATTFLRSNNATNFTVVVSRIRDERVTLDDGVTMDVTASSVFQFDLPPGDDL